MTTSNRTCPKPEAESKWPDITQLIPQRAPVLLVDRLLRAADEEAETCFTVPAGCFFLDDEGCLAETGLLEHIAQSASALAGWRAWQAGETEPPLGFIGEVKKFRCHGRPAPGSELHTVIRLAAEAGDVLLVEGETRVDGALVAETRLKVAIRPHTIG